MARFSKLLLNVLIKSFILSVVCLLISFLLCWINERSMVGNLLGTFGWMSFIITTYIFRLHIICFLLSLGNW